MKPMFFTALVPCDSGLPKSRSVVLAISLSEPVTNLAGSGSYTRFVYRGFSRPGVLRMGTAGNIEAPVSLIKDVLLVPASGTEAGELRSINWKGAMPLRSATLTPDRQDSASAT